MSYYLLKNLDKYTGNAPWCFSVERSEMDNVQRPNVIWGNTKVVLKDRNYISADRDKDTVVECESKICSHMA